VARRRVGGRAVYHRVRHQRSTRFYDWYLVVGIVALGLVVSVGILHWNKYEVGYTIYGLFLCFGIVVPRYCQSAAPAASERRAISGPLRRSKLTLTGAAG